MQSLAATTHRETFDLLYHQCEETESGQCAVASVVGSERYTGTNTCLELLSSRAASPRNTVAHEQAPIRTIVRELEFNWFD